jgi:hypothetical protein
VRRAPASALIIAFLFACAPAVKRTGQHAPTAAELAELWVDPGPTPRDLAHGSGGSASRPPAADASFAVLDKDTHGFSITYKVRDAGGRKWSVKIGPEAQTEVVSSRIVWALGYHQLPSYFVERWIAVEHAKGSMLGGARFRPDDDGLESRGTWSWQQNPFVGTHPYQGLLTVMLVLNSTDLKNDNNALYDVQGGLREGARRWYVVKDLGATLGETGRMDPRRGYIDGFEREPFIIGVHKQSVWFGYRGRHVELLDRISPDDVRWGCERLSRITDRQWTDAFHAGGYDDATTERFVRRIKQKIQQGLTVGEKGTER